MAQYIFEIDGNYVNFNGGGGLWRLARASNCIAWHFDQTGDLFFDVYDQQYVVKAENIAQVVIDGVPLAAASDFPDAITAVFTGLASSSPGGSSYLVYSFLFGQLSTSIPTSDILENTLTGTPIWSRLNTGRYLITLNGAFTLNKTIVPNNLVGNNVSLIPLSDANTVTGYFSIQPSGDGNSMYVQVFNSSFVFTDWSTLMSSDKMALEIRVYP